MTMSCKWVVRCSLYAAHVHVLGEFNNDYEKFGFNCELFFSNGNIKIIIFLKGLIVLTYVPTVIIIHYHDHK